jgi:ABC-type oligopeptide transport system ATPase subunit
VIPLTTTEDVLIEVTGLTKHFPVRQKRFRRLRGSVKPVNGMDIRIRERETLGLVGESGCEKRTASRAILRLVGGIQP